MQYSFLGNTGLYVSKLCFGTLTLGPLQLNLDERLGSEIIACAIKNGVNFFDTAELYQTYSYIKNGMKLSQKHDIIISSKTYAYTREMAVTAVESARKSLNRDYIDIFMLHEQESINTLNGHSHALEYLYECKQKGIIKAVGASMHHVAAVHGACALGLDVIHPMLNMNGLGIVDGSREDMENALIKANKNGIGIFSMKSLGGGNLYSSAEKCFNYILDKDYINSIAVGCGSLSEVMANIKFFSDRCFTKTQKTELEKKHRHLHISDWCVGCGKCADNCPQSAIKISEKTAICNADSCVLCGYCSAYCPLFAIKII